ncbi:MAG: DUF3015 family protein [Moraxella sp.]|nr:DUF3015 family protein [Moraxella sp.]
MFKKIALVSALVFSSTVAFADNDIGCGLGTQVWAGKEGKVAKILGATTNGTFANQLFGITFGTLGCGERGNKVTVQVVEFVDGNSEALARDMATGQGENLEVLAQLLNIQDQDQARFYTVVKANFANIYTTGATTADVVTALHQVLSGDDVLKTYA